MPSVFYSETEPPRIGSGVQPPPPAAPKPKGVPSIALPLAETPMTPGHPPRPPLSALPKYSSMDTSTNASKHALDPPTAQAPPSKQVRCKHIQSLLNLQKRSMWQHQHQLRCLNRADHVQKVLQRHSYLHPQRLRPCRQTPTRQIGKLD